MNQPHYHRTRAALTRAVVTLTAALVFALQAARAQFPSGPRPFLDHWAFNITNGFPTYYGYSAAGYTNVTCGGAGDFASAVLDSTNNAWLRYNVIQTTGTNEITVNQGSLLFWYSPNWAGTNKGGTGPGEWSRLFEIGSYTEDASYGWWSLLLDPDGANLYFCVQSNNGSGGTYLSAPIDWATNDWHFISLTYSSTNTSLYVDGNLLTNGNPLDVWPSADVLANGLYIGSDSNGLHQAHGAFDDIWTYAYEVNASTVTSVMISRAPLYSTPDISSGVSEPSQTPIFNAVTGSGNLINATAITNCAASNSVWIADLVLSPGSSNNLRNVTFTIQGGTSGLIYDVFANFVLDFSTNAALAWKWQGQGPSCMRYTIPNLPAGTCFLILGTPLDSDSDGLTDAYEYLVSKTDPNNPDTIGDGITDGWKVALGMNALLNSPRFQGSRSNFTYDPVGRLDLVSGVRSETINNDSEGNVTTSK